MTDSEREVERLQPQIERNDLKVEHVQGHEDYIEIYSVIGFEDTVRYTSLSGWLQGYWIGTGGSSLTW